MTIPEDIRKVELPADPLVLEIVGGVNLCCPDNLRLMTPYVLSEQRDWFEDEIKFLRSLLEPADRVVDIGANYGVYALTAASICSHGGVWAYEPCAMTAAHLRQSASRNSFSTLNVIQAALSDRTGHGYLATNPNAELNAVTGSHAADGGESIRLTTLDEEIDQFGEADIALLKIDAEGHEQEVIRGASAFLNAYSPLVMIEVKAGAVVDLKPVRMLGERGYAPYRLLPGLQLLVPFLDGEPLDGYQLNLFCCKADRAWQLQARGRLVLMDEAEHVRESAENVTVLWPEWLARLPYGQTCCAHWLNATAASPLPGWSVYRAVLNEWISAQNPDLCARQRWHLLRSAHAQLAQLVERDGNFPRLLSLARMAADLGARESAVDILGQLVDHLRSGQQPFVGEPFLLPAGEFESIPPGERLAAWAVCAVLDGFERLRAYSSYFSPQPTLEIAADMERLGFPSEATMRRARLALAITQV
jgi:FkbM family methyltransferase